MKHTPYAPLWQCCAGLLGMTAVLIGAVGAHLVTDAQAAASVERASSYQLIHAVVLFFSTLLTGKLVAVARWAILLGICLFCGSIYAKYFLMLSQATRFAPVGGMLLMAGWLALSLFGGLATLKRHLSSTSAIKISKNSQESLN